MSNPAPVHVDLLSFTYQRHIRQTGGECRPTLEELCRHITPEHAANWRKIGIQLGVYYSDLNAIEQIYSGLHEICCNEMFEKWLQNEPQATWNDVFSAVGIESWYDNPDRYHNLTDSIDAPSHSNTSTGFILGDVPRHCILHVLTVIKEAMYKGNSTLLDNFIKDISELVKSETTSPKPTSPTGNQQQYGAFKKLEPPPVIPVRVVQQFKNKAISTIEFAKLLESRLSSSAASAFIELDLQVLERICWKYYLMEKSSTLPQCSWLNHSSCYQLFLIFNKMLGKNYGIVVTGDRLNDLLEKIASLIQKTSDHVAYNSHHMTFDFTMYLLQIIACFNNFNLSYTKVTAIIRDIYEEEVNGVLKTGYLVKKGAKRKNWKKRWFVLKSDELSYYESNENLTLKGKIALNCHSDVLGTPDEKNKLYRFIIICGDSKRAFEIKAPDQHAKNEWLQAVKKILDDKMEMARGKPRSKSNPVPSPSSTRYVKSVSSVPAQSSSVDLHNIEPKPKVSGINEVDDSGSDSDCYVVPVQDHVVPTSCTKGIKHHKVSDDDDGEFSDEYDYPYLEGLNRLSFHTASPSSKHGYENVPNKAVSHNKVHVTRSTSSDKSKSPDSKKHEPLSNSRPANEKIMRASSQAEILEPLTEKEDYIKMHPDELSALVKSRSCDDGRPLQSTSDQQVIPRALTASSQAERNYKSSNSVTPATDDSLYMPLASEGELQANAKPNVKPRTRHSALVPNGTEEEHDDNLYLDLLTPSPEDLMRAQAHSNSRLLKRSVAATQRLPMTRKKPTS